MKENKTKEPLVMQFTNNAYHDIVNTIGYKIAESGGLLFGYLSDYVVREFVYDKDARTTGGSYTFNVPFLNEQIKELWETRQLACIGFIHSHPWGMKVPSAPDMWYFQRMFKSMPREKYLVPIVSTIPDGGFNLNPCILYEGKKSIVIADKIELINENHSSKYYDLVNPRPFWRPAAIKEEITDLVDQPKTSETLNDTFANSEPAGDGFAPDMSTHSNELYDPPTLGELIYDELYLLKRKANEFFKDLWGR